ncbi:MAG: RsmB/NOP family class I SAM-dependent RNA methyltransferase [Acetobacteraceae bacterium]|nr:RsmB/NOP family class I SAM-dependent RNA methyltransferase [Acetobacteraceae bacterium]
MTPQARLEAAIALLTEIYTTLNRPADAVANDFFRARRYIGSSDRRAVSERAWSTIRAHRRLGWWLGQDDATPRLRVSSLLLLEGVKLAALQEEFSGGRFAPQPLSSEERAILRRLEGRNLNHHSMLEAVRHEIPDWVFPLLEAQYGDALGQELVAMARPAPLDLRVNTLKGTHGDAQAALAAEGIATEPTRYSPWGLRAQGRQMVTTAKAFTEGLVEIQDEGSQLVALLVDAHPGMRVADYCAGAGGKTLAIAMRMNNRGHVVACDVSAPRLAGAVRRLRRAGVHNVEQHLLVTGDKWAKRNGQKYDRVLVDAPCTGTGTWRRNPDARMRLDARDLAALLPKQAAILDSASQLVRPGGKLVYATCSLLAQENEDQVRAFLTRHPEFRSRNLPESWPTGPGSVMALTPARHDTDGFFAAVLERRLLKRSQPEPVP